MLMTALIALSHDELFRWVVFGIVVFGAVSLWRMK